MSRKEQTAETLLLLLDSIERMLLDNKVDEEQSMKLATLIVDDFRYQCGGTSIYIPKGVGLDAILKHSKIYQDFRGNNHAELAKKYNLSEQRIYQIIRAMLAAETKRIQPDLF
ncbi:MAG: transcriptional regulator [Rheinheimera sp.]|uniref:Transcriptional regulator n=1 Tax=Pseudoalteromonas neustonica TaxID=1840331 RepID=A0ABY3FE81_9GAMM|nr:MULTISPECIES: Mor transcription activator family protein [Pseudoalteromonas]MAD76898.1 transcriptional regulator [Rheinheimera sp.]TVU83753.1 transcriptional regulator [Pseudoalteromonas neustonica]|tara:strand:+ start:21676 stop:22014 length:339 start_codon:yes stop_codon:yes gene_type:complete